MGPPPETMPEEKLALCHRQTVKDPGNHCSYRRPGSPARMLMQFGAPDAQAFNHKTTTQHSQKPHKDNEILTTIIEPGRSDSIAPVRQPRDPDHAQEAKDVQGQRIQQVKIAVQEVNAQVFMHRHHERANKEYDETGI